MLRERPNRPRADPWGGSGRHATRQRVPARLGLSPALSLTLRTEALERACASHRARESAGGAWAGLAHMLAHPVPARGGLSSEYGGDVGGYHWRGPPWNLFNSKAKRRGASGTIGVRLHRCADYDKWCAIPPRTPHNAQQVLVFPLVGLRTANTTHNKCSSFLL